jgi:DNA-binding transcriptional regulator YiaG
MTPAQLKSILERLGLGQAEAARTIGVDPQTMWRWTVGQRKVSPPERKLLKLWAAGKITQADIDRM